MSMNVKFAGFIGLVTALVLSIVAVQFALRSAPAADATAYAPTSTHIALRISRSQIFRSRNPIWDRFASTAKLQQRLAAGVQLIESKARARIQSIVLFQYDGTRKNEIAALFSTAQPLSRRAVHVLEDTVIDDAASLALLPTDAAQESFDFAPLHFLQLSPRVYAFVRIDAKQLFVKGATILPDDQSSIGIFLSGESARALAQRIGGYTASALALASESVASSRIYFDSVAGGSRIRVYTASSGEAELPNVSTPPRISAALDSVWYSSTMGVSNNPVQSIIAMIASPLVDSIARRYALTRPIIERSLASMQLIASRGDDWYVATGSEDAARSFAHLLASSFDYSVRERKLPDSSPYRELIKKIPERTTSTLAGTDVDEWHNASDESVFNFRSGEFFVVSNKRDFASAVIPDTDAQGGVTDSVAIASCVPDGSAQRITSVGYVLGQTPPGVLKDSKHLIFTQSTSSSGDIVTFICIGI